MNIWQQITTITAVIIGALWVGIGIKWGEDIYNYFIRPRFKKWIYKFKKIKINWQR